MAPSNKQLVFANEYLKDFNATQAAIRAGYSPATAYSQGQRLLKNVEVAQVIRVRLDEMTMSADEVLVRLTEQARSDLGVFFKVIEEWTFYPLPSYDVIDAREVDVLDNEGKATGEKKTSYWVRHVAIDMDKVIDPRYSHLLAEFSDSPKDGISIKPYSKQSALQTLARIRGLLVNKVDLTTGGEKINNNATDERFDRAISTLADALRESLSGANAKPEGAVDAPEQTSVDGTAIEG